MNVVKQNNTTNKNKKHQKRTKVQKLYLPQVIKLK